MTSLPLILASASPRRVELLRSLGVQFEIIPSAAEELHDETIPASQLCEINAERKARWVAERNPSHLVLGADTLVTLQNRIFGKPKDLAEAARMLAALQSQTHQVITGVSLQWLAARSLRLFHATTDVTFKPLNHTQILDYINKVHVLDKAGAYAIQEHGNLIIDKISGSYSNVVGLPLEQLQKEIRSFAAGKI